MQRVTDPAILYFGTPVVLVSTLNPDGTPNLAPMSSAWWLGHHAMLGLSSVSQTTLNLRREGECVLNLPSAEMAASVDRIAKTTGTDPVPERKRASLAEPDRIDPDAWRPLIMSSQRFYGLTGEQVADSRLAEIPESAYRK